MSGTERVDLRKLIERLSHGEMVIAAGSLVLLVALFLNWISVSSGVPGFDLGGVNGFHGWGWLTFLALLGVAALLVIRRFLSEQVKLPAMPASDSMLYLVGGGLEILGVLLFWVEYHNPSVLGLATIPTSLGFGWFVALVASLATVAGGCLTLRDTQTAGQQPSFSPPPASPIPPPAR